MPAIMPSTVAHGDRKLADLATRIEALVGTGGTDRIIKLRSTYEYARSLLWRARAAECADQVYLHGRTWKEVASDLSSAADGQYFSLMAASKWVRNFGPEFYWLLREVGTDITVARHVLHQTPSIHNDRTSLEELQKGGYRVIPAGWLIDNPTEELDLRKAWHQLAQPQGWLSD